MHTLPEEHEVNNRYELFCRAIVDRDDAAWSTIAVRYHSLLVTWARGATARSPVFEAAEDIADRAFSRAWMALTSAPTFDFPDLAAALGYLRSCVSAVVIDIARTQASRTGLRLQIEVGRAPRTEQEVIDALLHDEVWRLASAAVCCEQERVVLHSSLALGLASREILAKTPGLFDTVEDVHRSKRNLLSRLQRHPELRRIWEGGA